MMEWERKQATIDQERIAKLLPEAMRETLISPNEVDQNSESANVVDGLFAIARAIQRLAKAIEDQHTPS